MPRRRESSSPIPNLSLALSECELVLADEVLTPDSSRFWPMDTYHRAARSNLSTSNTCGTFWKPSSGKSSPRHRPSARGSGQRTSEKYKEAYRLLSGKTL